MLYLLKEYLFGDHYYEIGNCDSKEHLNKKIHTWKIHRNNYFELLGTNNNDENIDNYNSLIKDNKIEELLKEFTHGQTTRS